MGNVLVPDLLFLPVTSHPPGSLLHCESWDGQFSAATVARQQPADIE